ncbi:dUTP pyrophosphatase [Paenibacillus sp. 1182]|uniref:dUTP diphosphatase n=1 Tax=Paenibacillus sp. 1182 TaxID=2806565 RepID=UPI001AE0F954|nr:deoxyuridine 5'-triphosphate nucleotidohydrolase [Paenibacillus sp. 1182]MBP1312303.1 dUTP pyrophosphatase [Paenibacillus sp. 1182]
MDVRVKKVSEDAVLPKYATTGAAAFDLVATEEVVIAPGETKRVPLGLAFEVPEGYVLIIAMRSGISVKTKLRQPNGIGVIDSDYRGEVSMLFDNTNEVFAAGTNVIYFVDGKFGNHTEFVQEGTYLIKKGDRVAQGFIMETPKINLVEANELTETERGVGGFGHTGVQS